MPQKGQNVTRVKPLLFKITKSRTHRAGKIDTPRLSTFVARGNSGSLFHTVASGFTHLAAWVSSSIPSGITHSSPVPDLCLPVDVGVGFELFLKLKCAPTPPSTRWMHVVQVREHELIPPQPSLGFHQRSVEAK